MRDMFTATGWVIWGFILLVAISAGLYFVQPYFIAKETQTIRQSNAYVTSKQVALTTFKADYDRLEVQLSSLRHDGVEKNKDLISALEGQEQGIIRQMKQEAGLIPDQVQPDVRAFLSSKR